MTDNNVQKDLVHEELATVLKKIKGHLHSINRFLMVKGDTLWTSVRIQSEKLWGTLHSFRIDNADREGSEQLLNAVDKAAGQASRLRSLLLHNSDFDRGLVVKEFLILRQYVEQLEKAMVRYVHFLNHGVMATQIGTIKWASTITGKSEITIRRYIRAKKIFAYQLEKIWWVPFEEIKNIQKGGGNDGK